MFALRRVTSSFRHAFLYLFDYSRRSVGCVVLAFLVIGSVCSSASETQTVSGHFTNLDDQSGVWLGVVAEDGKDPSWSLVGTEKFEIQVPTSAVALLAVTKHRTPQLLDLKRQATPKPIEIHFTQGFTLTGTVRSNEGRRLNNAKVKFAPVDVNGIGIPNSVWPTYTVASDGRFHIKGLEEGKYVLEASAEEHVPLILDDIPITGRDGTKLGLELLNGSYISGKVVDRAGDGVSGVEVFALWHDRKGKITHKTGVIGNGFSNQFGIQRLDKTRTAQDGSYRLGPVETATLMNLWTDPKGEGTAKASYVPAPNHNLILQLHREMVRGRVLDAGTGEPVEKFSLIAYHGNGASAEKHDIANPTGEFEVAVNSNTHNLHIETPGYSFWFDRLLKNENSTYDLGEILLERPRSLKGQLWNAQTDAPIVGALVRLSEREFDDRYARMAFGNQIKNDQMSVTNEHGDYLLQAIPQQAFLLELSLGEMGGTHRVRVPSDVSVFDIALNLDSVVSGKLTLVDGTPARGTVRLVGSYGSLGYDVEADGSFRLEHVSPGTYRLRGESEDGLVKSQKLRLRTGESIQNVQLLVDLGYQITGTISGLAGFEYLEMNVLNTNRKFVLKRTFRNGEYTLRGLPQEALIHANTSSGRSIVRHVRFSEQDRSKVDFNFEGDSSLSGTVQSGTKPLSGMRLSVLPKDPRTPGASTTTTAIGAYWIHGLSDGLHRIKTHTSYSYEVVVSGQTVRDISLTPISLSGTVTSNLTGLPLPGIRVRLEGKNGHEGVGDLTLTSRTGSDGTFVFDGLIHGPYSLHVSHSDFDTTTRDIQIDGIQSVSLSLERATGSGSQR